MFIAVKNSKDIANVRSMGLGVDEDNEPAPENVSKTEIREEFSMRMASQSWGWFVIDNRAVTVALDVKPSLIHVKGELLKNIIFVSMCILFFPFDFLQNFIIKETNKGLKKNKLKETDPGGVLNFIGSLIFMYCFLGFKKNNDSVQN